MEQIRSFIAIELPDAVKIGLKQLQDRLKAADPSGAKWVDPNSIHLTLKFLGNVNSDKLENIVDAIKDSAQVAKPFQLEIQKLGAFPSLNRVQIVWVGLSGDLDQLQRLQEKLESNLTPLGFPAEKRGFTPHLTLARLRDFATPPQRQTLGEIISKTKIDANLHIKVDSISLMRSQLTRAGAIYSCLSSVDL